MSNTNSPTIRKILQLHLHTTIKLTHFLSSSIIYILLMSNQHFKVYSSSQLWKCGECWWNCFYKVYFKYHFRLLPRNCNKNLTIFLVWTTSILRSQACGVSSWLKPLQCLDLQDHQSLLRRAWGQCYYSSHPVRRSEIYDHIQKKIYDVTDQIAEMYSYKGLSVLH